MSTRFLEFNYLFKGEGSSRPSILNRTSIPLQSSDRQFPFESELRTLTQMLEFENGYWRLGLLREKEKWGLNNSNSAPRLQMEFH